MAVLVREAIRFDEGDPRRMLRHLDGWARRALPGVEEWTSVLERCGQWADYSARNQVLLASYGVATPVAGSATWTLVPSTEEGRPCAVRAGEHGLPVRVPVVDGGEVDSDRSRLSARSQTIAGSHRWELVFAEEQLARRPAPGALAPVRTPRLTDVEWVEVVRVATGRVLGRMPRRVDDPAAQLASLAARVPFQSGRTRLTSELAAQAGWLVADRAGMAGGPMPEFDPVGLTPRERWQRVVEVRHAAGVVLAGVSHAVGVDLAASTLPRHGLADDRSVPAGRRNYLAPADLRGLPLGMWVEVGPYTKSEWLARGVAGAAGVGAFLRVTDRSYLAVYDARGVAIWRMETVGRGAHQGLIIEGTADNVTKAKDAARVALMDRFPDVAAAVGPPVPVKVLSPGVGWEPLAGGRDERTERHIVDERVQAVVAPRPGGRWGSWVTVDGELRQGPLSGSRDEARADADRLAVGAMGELARYTPERANRLVADLADRPEGWDRQRLVDLVGHRLTDSDRARLSTTVDPAQLVELMAATGVLTGRTMLAVLHAEAVDAGAVARIVANLGVPVPEVIIQLHERWGVDRLEAGMAVGATVAELRALGCTPVELVAAAPREALRSLDSRESTWSSVAGTLLEAGYTVADAVTHLVAHTPTPRAFAAGVSAIVDDPTTAFGLVGQRAQPEDLVALAERFGLDSDATGRLAVSAGMDAAGAASVVTIRAWGGRGVDHGPDFPQHALDEVRVGVPDVDLGAEL